MARQLVSSALLLGLTLGWAATAQGQTIPPGSVIEPAGVVDISAHGLESLIGLAVPLLPTELPLGDFDLPDLVDPIDPILACGLDLSVTNVWGRLELDALDLIPRNGDLLLSIEASVWVNDPTDPMVISAVGCDPYTPCTGHVGPIGLEITSTIELTTVGGVLQAEVGPFVNNLDTALSASEVNLSSDCELSILLDLVGGILGADVIDVAIEEFRPAIEDALVGLPATIEEAINPTLADLAITEEIDLLGTAIELSLTPSSALHTEQGVRLGLAGQIGGAGGVHPCMADFEIPAGSLSTPFDPPADIAELVPGRPNTYALALMVDDDFANAALFSAWAGGLLCQQLADLSGFSLSTGLLAPAFGIGSEAQQAVDALTGGESPVVIELAPALPPIISYDTRHDVRLDLPALGIDFYVDVEGRTARLMRVNVDLAVGLDIALTRTGGLALEVEILADELNPQVTYNELLPEVNEAVETNFPGFLDTVLGLPPVQDLLAGLAFNLPTFDGIGVAELYVAAVGGGADWLGVYVELGPSEGGDAPPSDCGGCGDTGGCEDLGGIGGCEEGCSTEDLLAEAGCDDPASELTCAQLPARRARDARRRRTQGWPVSALLLVGSALFVLRRRQLGG